MISQEYRDQLTEIAEKWTLEQLKALWRNYYGEASWDEHIEFANAILFAHNGEVTRAIQEATEVLVSCRDHWKSAFHNERGKVIRLSNQIHAIHGKKCICTICELVRTKGASKPK